MFHKVVKKALMLSVAATLVVTPVVASASGLVQGVDYGPYGPTYGSSSSSSSSSSGGSSKSSTKVEETKIPTVTLADGTVLNSTVAGSSKATSIKGIAVAAPAAVVNAALGVKEGEKAFVTIADSNYGPAAKASLENAAAALGAQIEAVLDINMGKLNANGKFELVKNASKLVEFRLAPKGTLKAGYEWAIVRVQAGGAVTVLPNWSSNAGEIQFFTDGSGVFGLTQVPAGSLDNVKVAQYQQANS